MFGYMDLLIIIKWNTDWVGNGNDSKAPSIVNQMIELFLNHGEQIDPSKEIPMFKGQNWINKFILIIILITPPWMLFTKPYLIISEHYRILKKK